MHPAPSSDCETDAVTSATSATSATLALGAAGAGTWQWCAVDDRVTLDAQAASLCGWPPEPCSLGWGQWRAALAPPDDAALDEARQAWVYPGEVRLRLHRPGRPTQALWLIGQVQAGADGVPASAQGLLLALPADEAHAPARAPSDDRPRDDVIAAVSHELRTPLNAILGFTRLAQAELASPAAHRLLRPILQAGELMLGVVNDLVDDARLEAGQLDIHPDLPLRLSALVARVAALAAPLRQSDAVRLYAYADADVPDHLLGDGQRLAQVLLNLLANALKFTDGGEVVLRVQRLADVGHAGAPAVRLHFTVADSGRGIAAEALDRVGRPFDRLGSDATSERAGSGLGLSIVRRLLELHAARLKVASVEGGGSLFGFDLELPIDVTALSQPVGVSPLPVAWVHTADDRLFATVATQWRSHDQIAVRATAGGAAPVSSVHIVDLAAPDAPAVRRAPHGRGGARLCTRADGLGRAVGRRRSAAVPLHALADAVPGLRRTADGPLAYQAALSGLRVLVIEDNAFNREVMAGYLRHMGVRPRLAETLGAARALLAREHVDLLLIDLRLPDGHGLDFARELLQSPGGARAAIAVCSAQISPADELEAQALGALACLTKPVDPEVLRQLLWRLRDAPAPAAPSDTAPTPLPITPALWRLFEDQRHTWCARIEASRAAGDRDALREAVHALRGSLGILRATAALALAQQVEQGLLDGRPLDQLPVAALIAATDALQPG